MKNKRWKNIDALFTDFDDYEMIMEKSVLQRNKYTKRARLKPMASVAGAGEPHVENRANHMVQTATEAKKLARGLGLNETVSYIGMLWHDAGHPFGAHEGEQTMNIIGELLNVGFFHHNAKGIDVILSENLIGKIIDDIPEARNNEKLKKNLKNDIWYFLDFIVGHDGESSKKDEITQKEKCKKYKSIKEAVLDKASTANRTNSYKCQVETLEAQLSKPADILAYLKSDMLDGFSQGIITNFSDDYLELIGKILCESYNETEKINELLKDNKNKALENKIRVKRIKDAKEFIDKIRREELRETKDDIDNLHDKEILGVVDNILKASKEKGANLFNIDENSEELLDFICNNEIDKYRENQELKKIGKNFIASDINKIRDYTKKMIRIRKRVVEKVMTSIQETLENDYIESTLKRWKKIEDNEKELLGNKNYSELDEHERQKLDELRKKEKKKAMGFSDKAMEIIYGAKGMKKLNYTEYVQNTKKEYQGHCLPKATFKMVKQCANAIVKTGIIRDKFYDQSVRKHIKDEEIKKYMIIPEREESEYDNYKLKIGIREVGNLKIARERKKKYTKRKVSSKKMQEQEKAKLFKDVYNYTQRQSIRFAMSCEDVYHAIPYTVRSMVKKALDSHYEPNEYLKEEDKKAVYKIRKDLAKRFGQYDGMAVTSDNLEKYINELIESERNNLETKVATEISIKYLAGKTDDGIRDLLIKTGNMSQAEFNKENIPSKKANKNVQKLSRNLTGEEKQEKEEEFKSRVKQKTKPLFVIENDETR